MNNNEKNQLQSINEKIELLEKRRDFELKRARYNASKDSRRQRARRLIETGALAEKYFEMDHLTIPEREELLKSFSTFVNSNKPNKFKKRNLEI